MDLHMFISSAGCHIIIHPALTTHTGMLYCFAVDAVLLYIRLRWVALYITMTVAFVSCQIIKSVFLYCAYLWENYQTKAPF